MMISAKSHHIIHAPASLDTGKCYKTTSQQVRRITEITSDGLVGYESRGSSYKGQSSWNYGGPNKSQWPSKEVFASQVDEEVRCDWDPNFG